MLALLTPLVCAFVVYVVLIILNEQFDLFRDRFPSTAAKIAAYALLGLLLIFMTVIVVASSQRQLTPQQLAGTPFYQLFLLHIALILFLAGWWVFTGRSPLLQFLNIQREGVGKSGLIGLAVGVGGWIFTLLLAGMIALILKASGLLQQPKPSPMIFFLAAMPLWKKLLIVLSAMTVEEAFFRGWLQKRVGLLVSTLFFALAHVGLGQPFLLVGVAIISLIIGFTFYRTKNLIPGIIAHGVFDAIQLFVIIPIAFKSMGM